MTKENKLTISIKEASYISGLPESLIRKQIDNKKIPSAYSIQHKSRKSYVIFRRPFMDWLKGISNG